MGSFVLRAARSMSACAVVLCSLAPNASAETSLAPGNGGGIDTRLFRAAVDSKGFFTVDGADVVPRGDIFFGLVLDAGFGLLKVRDPVDPEGARNVVDTQLHGVLSIGGSPLPNLVIGLGIPTDVVSGDPLGAPPPPGIAENRKTDVNAFFTGTWTAFAKYRLLDPDAAPLGLAFVLRGETGLSDEAKRGYAAGAGVTVTPNAVLERRFGAARRLRVGANVGASFVLGDGSRVGDLVAGDPGASLRYGHLARASLAIGYRLTDDLDVAAETYGSKLLGGDAGGTSGTSIEAAAGVRVFVERNSYLLLGGGVGATKGFQSAGKRAFLGFVFEPSIGDRDGDGVKDDVDQCPDVPEDRDGFQDQDGCPDPDNDGDHFLDKDDRCPNDAETPNGFVDDDGCPDTVPSPPPKEHEKIEEKEVLTFDNGIGILLEPIQFEYDSAAIAKASFPVLDGAAKILQAHPEYVLIEIEGHADERGPAPYNLQLTQKRVESVMKALVARGVSASRLRATGYGEYCPLDGAHDEAAWAKNRRVEFRVVKTKDGPTGVPLGCDEAAAHGVKAKAVP